MATQVIKGARLLGQANDGGVSFQPGKVIEQTKDAFEAVRQEARRRDAILTGPARVYIIVEQDVIV